MSAKKMVVLFDESGTPSINDDPRCDWFLGVGVAYQYSDEEGIFTNAERCCGLANSKPLKSDRIGIDRAIRIAELLRVLPVFIQVSSLNTASQLLRSTVSAYEEFGERARREVRHIRKRPVSQILHSLVLDHCLFNLITHYFESGGSDACFEVNIDSWSLPEGDISISLEHRASSLYKKISLFCTELGGGRIAAIDTLKMLEVDGKRKRFVDTVASILSRGYLKSANPKYSRDTAELLEGCGKARFLDATGYSIEIMEKVMRR